MRIAVLADIHGNLHALEAVVADLQDQSPDLVIVAGDFQNRGPQPFEVMQLLEASGWMLLRGNHEDYVVWQSESEASTDEADFYNWQPARWTAERILDSINAIRQLPIAVTFEAPNRSPVTVAHGSPRANDEGFFPATSETRAREMLGKYPPRLLCCGHSHIPLIRQVEQTLVVNVGSVGFPFDGDARAAYGLLDWAGTEWRIEIRRVHYPLEAVLKTIETVKFHEGTGPLGLIIRRELESARPHLNLFWYLFGEPVRRAELTFQAAVDAYLGISQEDVEDWYQARSARHHK
jgi:putative phosphoesterase